MKTYWYKCLLLDNPYGHINANHEPFKSVAWLRMPAIGFDFSWRHKDLATMKTDRGRHSSPNASKKVTFISTFMNIE